MTQYQVKIEAIIKDPKALEEQQEANLSRFHMLHFMGITMGRFLDHNFSVIAIVALLRLIRHFSTLAFLIQTKMLMVIFRILDLHFKLQ